VVSGDWEAAAHAWNRRWPRFAALVPGQRHAAPSNTWRRCAALIAAGRSDADIATKLSISPKIVGHHVGAILAKLGVDNRTRAAAHCRRPETTES
jgi:DNA-binding CsgD family transcriptional regulator